MAYPQLLIRKMATNNFELFHLTSSASTTVAGRGFTPSDGFYDMDRDFFQFKEFSGRVNFGNMTGASRFPYKWTDVKVQIGTLGSIESFGSKAAVKNRLNEIGFPRVTNDGSGVYFSAGTDISITGNGSEAMPYVISYTGSGGGGSIPTTVRIIAMESEGYYHEIPEGKTAIQVHVGTSYVDTILWVQENNEVYIEYQTFDGDIIEILVA